MAKEWAAKTKSIKSLPEHVSKPESEETPADEVQEARLGISEPGEKLPLKARVKPRRLFQKR
jgi:hypothetical protein